MLSMAVKRLRYAGTEITEAEDRLEELCDGLERATRLQQRKPMQDMLSSVSIAVQQMEKAGL